MLIAARLEWLKAVRRYDYAMKLNRQALLRFGLRLKDKVSEDDVSGAAAEMAYRFFLALFPFFIFLAALGGFAASAFNVQNPTDEIMDMLGESLPDDASSVLRGQLENVIEGQNAGLLSVGIVGAVWAAAGGVGALMKKMNIIYSVDEDRSMVARYGIAIGLTVFSAGLIIVAFIIFFVGQIYGPRLGAEVGLAETTAEMVSLARWPAAVVLVILAVAFVYWLAPNTRLPIRWLSPGALFFAIAWLVASFGFSFYVANFGSYNATYGALAGIVILLFWFYLTSFLILLGGEINAVLAEKLEIDENGPQREFGEERPSPVATLAAPAGLAMVGALWLMALVHGIRRSN